ncbi:hypothetical protein C2845_PM05G05970 [Panicum miliaceum]|uniref:Uncharacterized protein n=1 Tax=Panicum miliaceum TaxID=4540 RepID=A0A3L6T3X7_PANMI|nr:hypothetical protein C2845_PM05G05970 [Panicum miliaceum]
MPPALAAFLSAARAASPKIAVLAEQEAGHNGVSFRKRFPEALSYYAAAYDSLDAAAAAYRRPAAERAEVSARCWARRSGTCSCGRAPAGASGTTGCTTGLCAWRSPGSETCP